MAELFTSKTEISAPEKLSAILSSAAEWLVLSSIVLVSLFFLPNVSQPLELPKQVILLVVVSLACLAWLGTMNMKKQFALRRSAANPLVLLLVAATAISAMVSSSKSVGLVGGNGQEYLSLLTAALFAAMFFVIMNIPEKRPFVERALMALVIAGGIVSLFALLQYSGVKIFSVKSSSTFNLIGSTVVLGLYAAVTVVLSSIFFVVGTSEKHARLKKIIVGICGLLAFVMVLVIDFWPVWVAVILGIVAILVYSLVNPRIFARLSWLVVPMVVVVISMSMLFVNLPLPIRAPAEVFPSFSKSLSVTSHALLNHPFFGSGPGGYANEFAMFRGPELNKSSLWFLQFDRGTSLLNTVAVTMGLAGLVVWIAIILFGVGKAIAYLFFSAKRDDHSLMEVLTVTVAWIASAAGLVIYGASIATLFVFWLLFALLIRATSAGNVEMDLQTSPRSAISVTFASVIVIVLCLAGWFITGARLYADIAFAKALNTDASIQIDSVIKSLEKAAALNPQSDTIFRNLSQAYVIDIQQLANDAKKDVATRNKQVQTLSSQAIKAGQQAAAIAPENPQNWAQLGSVYESMISYINNASDQAIDAYSKAAALDPSSPTNPTSLGRVYLAVASKAVADLAAAKDVTGKAEAQKKIDDALAKAETMLNKALALKSDYAAAGYQLALVKDAQGKTKEAIAGLQKIELTNPTDMGVAFQLAVLYYRDNQKDKAQSELERTIASVPSFSNARWILALILEEKQKWDEAIVQLQAVLKDNPNNPTVQQKLKVLQSEKAANAPIAQPSNSSVLQDNNAGPASIYSPAAVPPAPSSLKKKKK